jgi:hypothetical protein
MLKRSPARLATRSGTVDARDQPHGRNAELGQTTQQDAKGMLAPMMKASGFQAMAPIFSPSGALTTMALKITASPR